MPSLSRASRSGRLSPRLPIISLIAGALLLGLPGAGVSPTLVAAAQSGTPTSGEMIAPTECLVDPITDEQLAMLAATPADQDMSSPTVAGSPAAGSTDAFMPPTGDPASDDEVAAVTDTMTQVVACLNAGDQRRVNALYTNAYLARNLAGADLADSAATPHPAPAAIQVTLVEIREVVRLDDGRLGATVVLGSEGSPRQTVQYSVLADQDGQWRIDEETVIAAEGDATPMATPVA